MPTDDDLTTVLRRGLRRAAADVYPEPDLVDIVRRRYIRSRRRRLAIGVAVPAAALAAGSGLALAGQNTPGHATNGSPSQTALAGPSPSKPAPSGSTPKTASRTSIPMRLVSYRLDRQVLRRHHSAAANCPVNATSPVAKAPNPAGVPGVWFFTNGQCVFVAVGGADTKPAHAVPLHVNGYPGLYSTLEDGVRTIYAPGIGGRGWWVLTMPASAPQDVAVRIIVPTH